MQSHQYTGRFAPSPTGPLHFGSVVAALASYLDARAHHGRWLVRIEDLDPPREVAGATDQILQTLTDLKMIADAPVCWQSQRHDAYQAALQVLENKNLLYPCGCSRREINAYHAQHQTAPALAHVYPGTCRHGMAPGKPCRSIRLRVGQATVRWHDRVAGFAHGAEQTDHLAVTTGDFPVRRENGLWAYQLAVVVDDRDSAVTDVVRGVDLVDSTARQIYLQQCLGMPRVRYLHIPVVNVPGSSDKLSKQTGATGVVTNTSERERISLLNRGLAHLQLPPVSAATLAEFWPQASRQWRASTWMN